MNRIQTKLAVIGGGPAGVCGALAAARRGVPTVLIHDRPVLGGNSSSEIRVWSRGALGAGNVYSEEMGIWGELKLTNLYRNPDGNPVFWDEVLLDAALKEPNLRLFLNTEVTGLTMEGSRVTSVSGNQQGSQAALTVEAEVFLDATGDGCLGYWAGLSYYLGDVYIPSKDAPVPEKPELLGCSILFYTRREDHPVPFIPPDYAYSLERISQLIDQGGRIVSEKMSGSDCWWFEYGGNKDTIGQIQDIGLELKRMVMGVWNYIKNSGRYHADAYTLEWVGNLPGKRESRRMVTDYLLTEEDIRTGRQFPDSAFYGGWYMDNHPSGGMHDTQQENCVQIPVNIYPIPLRCLYNSRISNLLFAGRNIGTQRQAFISSRVMNTCALSGQAAGALASAMLSAGKAPSELTPEEIQKIQCSLTREDLFIPGYLLRDPEDRSADAAVTASSHHDGRWGAEQGSLSLDSGGFVLFPGLPGQSPDLAVWASAPARLTGTWYRSPLPSRFCPGTPAGQLEADIPQGRSVLSLSVPENCAEQFCTLVLAPCPGVNIPCVQRQREGFLCGHQDSPLYLEPMLAYPKDAGLYAPQRAAEFPDRPWNSPNQWLADPEDPAPWLELNWDTPQTIHQVRLFLDPSLNEELPSTHAKYWQESHHFVPRSGMPPALIRDARLQIRLPDGSWTDLTQFRDNYLRLVVLELPAPVTGAGLRLVVDKTWGGTPAVYHVGVY